MKKTFLKYISWKYGGLPQSLRPPLGYHPLYSPKSVGWIFIYHLRFGLWKIDEFLYQRCK